MNKNKIIHISEIEEQRNYLIYNDKYEKVQGFKFRSSKKVLLENLKQNAIISELEKRLPQVRQPTAMNSSRTTKIFSLDGKKIGQIKKNAKKTTIEFNGDILDNYQQEIENFFEQLLANSKN